MEAMEQFPVKKERIFRLVPRSWRGWTGVAAILFFLCLLLGWILSRATPPWYETMDPNQNAVIDESDIAQKRLLELHTVLQRLPLGTQRWFIRQDEINSMLAIRFAPPLNVDGYRRAVSPAPISDPVVVFTPGKVTVSARSNKIPGSDPRGGVGSIVFTVEIIQSDDGKPMGLVKLSSVWIGLLPVPRSLLQGRLQGLLPSLTDMAVNIVQNQTGADSRENNLQHVRQVVEAMMEGKPFPLDYTFDHRSFVIKELRPDQDSEGGLFTLVVEPVPMPRAAAR